LARRLIFRSQRNTTLMEVGIYDTDPQMAANIVNAVAAVYIEKQRELRGQLISQALGQLEESVKEQRKAVQEAKLKQARMATDYGIIDHDPENLTGNDFALTEVSTNQKELEETRVKA